jgi:hypothetical protein
MQIFRKNHRFFNFQFDICNLQFILVDFFGRTKNLDYVGSGWKQQMVERLLGISGRMFYHLILRPKEYLNQRKKEKNETPKLGKKGA